MDPRPLLTAIVTAISGALDNTREWLATMQSNPINDFLQGALLLVRRNLTKITGVSIGGLTNTATALACVAVNVLALARMLGHKDPSVTLRVYADPFDSDLDAIAVTLHNQYSPAIVGKMWAEDGSAGTAEAAN